jgi:hypothetical protein
MTRSMSPRRSGSELLRIQREGNLAMRTLQDELAAHQRAVFDLLEKIRIENEQLSIHNQMLCEQLDMLCIQRAQATTGRR